MKPVITDLTTGRNEYPVIVKISAKGFKVTCELSNGRLQTFYKSIWGYNSSFGYDRLWVADAELNDITETFIEEYKGKTYTTEKGAQ